MQPGFQRVSVNLKPETYEKLRRLAFDNRTNMSDLIREAIDQYLAGLKESGDRP